ncbi:hypothetical protein EYF80_031094 [Liparis tanakae]|uniref:Uncharacterized protein n=1 Tax=Liparis tanakae TaxID=230148 RepID=A0A4Z2GZK4_9TELE|nr:hypothetical protein EYF80_031094 [Liparis tanakae]
MSILRPQTEERRAPSAQERGSLKGLLPVGTPTSSASLPAFCRQYCWSSAAAWDTWEPADELTALTGSETLEGKGWRGKAGGERLEGKGWLGFFPNDLSPLQDIENKERRKETPASKFT